jgi:dihydrofolate reductase
MANVLVNMSMSLDGFVAGLNVGVEFPLGEGGERLHDWLFNRGSSRRGDASHISANGVDAEVTQEVLATTGAVILGKRTFDVGVELWGDTPYPVPCFVLTHKPRAELVKPSGTFTFVTDGIESALRQAKKAAGEKKVNLMGADVAQQ